MALRVHVHVHVKRQRVAALLVKAGTCIFLGSGAVYARDMTQACGSAAALVDRVPLRNAPCLMSTT